MASNNISLASLTVSLGMNSAQFRSGLQNAQRSYASFHKSIARGVANTTAALKGVGVGVGAMAASFAAGGYAIKRSLDSIDEVRRLADNVGLAVDEFSAYSYAAERAGLSSDRFADVVKDLNVKIQDAAEAGSGPLVDFFDQIGDSAKAWAELEPAEQFRRFNRELSSMSNNQARFWLDELNDSAAELFSSLRSGEFERMTQEATAFGYALDENAVRSSREAKLAIDGLLSTLNTTWTQILVNLSPAIVSLSGHLNDLIRDAAATEGGFSGLGKTMALSLINATEAITIATTSMLNGMITKAQEVGQVLGQDWFVNPKQRSLELTIEKLQQVRAEVERTKGEWVDGGDVPGFYRLPQEALDEMAELDNRIAKLRKQLSGHIDNSALLAALAEIREQVKSFTVADSPTLIQKEELEKMDEAALLLARQTAAYKQYYQSRVEGEKAAQKAAEETMSWQENALKELKKSQRGLGDLFTDQLSRFSAGVGTAFETAVFETKSLGDSVSSIFEGMGRAMVAFFGEWAAQRMAQWILEKTIGAADATGYMTSVGARGAAETQLGALNAASSTAAIPIIGPLLAPGAAMAFEALGAGMTAAAVTAASGTLAGMAHSGIDTVPREGTWLLDRGERVYTNDSAARLDQMYSRIMAQPAQASPTYVMIQATDAKGVDRWARDNSKALSKGIEREKRLRGIV